MRYGEAVRSDARVNRSNKDSSKTSH